MLQHNPDGLIVLDDEGRVLFANPSAARLFGYTTDELVGVQLGLPIGDDDPASEIDVLHKDAGPLVVEMRSARLQWEGRMAHLVTLRDITAHKRRAEALRQAQQLVLSVLNALQTSIAVVDHTGEIILVNEAWAASAREGGDPNVEHTGVGINYVEVCRTSAAHGDADASRVLEGMLGTISGALPSFEHEYPCHTPTEKRRYLMRALPLDLDGGRGLVIAHLNITRQYAAARAQAERETFTSIEAAHLREQQAFEHFIMGVPPGALRALPARPGLDDRHLGGFVGQYVMLIEQALLQRAYRVHDAQNARVREFAEALGHADAHPRDVIQIHLRALQRNRQAQRAPDLLQAQVEESRLILLEVLGYLAAFYRENRQIPPAR
ncbi:MAG: PAS domain-containing protein [Chloroflexi bacterium]|nr:PAS domain-containing protein [Chloroflexota bacterium]